MKSFSLKRALDFNTVTMGIATAGFGFAGAVLANRNPNTCDPSIGLKLLVTVAIAAFALSIFFGVLVVGRATNIVSLDDPAKMMPDEAMIDDAVMQKWGRRHSGCLLIGLSAAAILTLNQIWDWL